MTFSTEGEEYWIVGPTYELARPEFIYLLEIGGRSGALDLSTVSEPRVGPCSVKTTSGAVITTHSSQDEKRLAGIAPSGILMTEAAQQTWETFLRLRARVGERRAPLLLSGTLEAGMKWYTDLWESWQSANMDGGRSFSVPTWANWAIYPGGRQDPEIKALEATFPPDVFMERFGAVPCPPATLVFREFSHVPHVKACLFNPGLPVQVWVDPGYAHAYAVLAVQIDDMEYGTAGRTMKVVKGIDEVYERGITAQDIIMQCKERNWWRRVKGGVIDVAGRAHPGMESHVEIWRKAAGIYLRSEKVPIPDGILRHRTFLRDPETGLPRLFHDPKCRGTIAEYGMYKYQTVKENRPQKELPQDVNNDAMKAIAYGLVGNFGFCKPSLPQRVQFTFRRV